MLINPKEEIIKALHGYYAEIPIYAEEIKQGFKAPCFFVQQLKLTQKDGLQNIMNARWILIFSISLKMKLTKR